MPITITGGDKKFTHFITDVNTGTHVEWKFNTNFMCINLLTRGIGICPKVGMLFNKLLEYITPMMTIIGIKSNLGCNVPIKLVSH